MFCYIFRLSLEQSYRKNKDGTRATTAQLYPGRDIFEFDQGARDQEPTNHSAHFVEWKSSYITISNILDGTAFLPQGVTML